MEVADMAAEVTGAEATGAVTAWAAPTTAALTTAAACIAADTAAACMAAATAAASTTAAGAGPCRSSSGSAAPTVTETRPWGERVDDQRLTSPGERRPSAQRERDRSRGDRGAAGIRPDGET